MSKEEGAGEPFSINCSLFSGYTEHFNAFVEDKFTSGSLKL